MLKKRVQDLSSDIQKDKKEEAPMNQRIRRTQDDIKKIFLDSYLKKNKLNPDDEKIKEAGLTEPLNNLLKDLSERELSNSKRMSKVIGQKIKFRDQFDSNIDEIKKDTLETKDADSITALKEIERKRAVEKFLPSILKEFKDEDLSSNEVYDRLQEVYREGETDVRREDFEKRLSEAFAIAYPNLFRERVRRQERKRLYEEDTPNTGNSSGFSKSKGRSNSRVPKHSSNQPIGDWFKKS